MRRSIRLSAVAGCVLGAAAFAPALPHLRPASDTDRTEWRAELVQLERHLAIAYANFEWTTAARRLDLPALHAAADSTLLAAPNRSAARRAFRTLISAFDDGHLRISPPAHPLLALAETAWRGSAAPIPVETGAASACRRMGFSKRGGGSRASFDELPGYVPVEVQPFQSGLLPLGDGRQVGIIKIASFGENGYGNVCEEAWEAARAELADPCDDECQSQIWQDTGNRLLAALERTATALSSAGVDAIVVDLTGNGGGSELADAMARVLTPIPLRAQRVGIIRHPHALTSLRSGDSVIAAELARTDLSDEHRSLLTEARQRSGRTIRQAGTPCDLAPLWRGHLPSCRQLVEDSVFATGFLAHAAPGALDGLAAAGVLFGTSKYRYREGVYSGPLFLLVDRQSASATEEFVAMLRDNNAAIVLGERTYGAGCGYTNGGIRLELRHVGMTLRAPDCVRLRASGENERAGITPDLDVPWADAPDGAARAAAAVTTFRSCLPLWSPAPPRGSAEPSRSRLAEPGGPLASALGPAPVSRSCSAS